MLMQIFTPLNIAPSEQTLNIIRQIAYTYRVVRVNGNLEPCCLN